MTETDPIEIATRVQADPKVRAAWDKWQEARGRHKLEPWAVNRATVDIFRGRWEAAIREAMNDLTARPT